MYSQISTKVHLFCICLALLRNVLCLLLVGDSFILYYEAEIYIEPSDIFKN